MHSNFIGSTIDCYIIISCFIIDCFFFETDSPYLTPTPYRGERNEPKHVVEICKFVAVLRGVSTDELEKITDENAKKFFKI